MLKLTYSKLYRKITNYKVAVIFFSIFAIEIFTILSAISFIACSDEKKTSEDATSASVLIEDTQWNPLDGNNFHEFTIVNRTDEPLEEITIEFTFFDTSGKKIERQTQALSLNLSPHDAIRKASVISGKTNPNATRVEYQVIRMRSKKLKKHTGKND